MNTYIYIYVPNISIKNILSIMYMRNLLCLWFMHQLLSYFWWKETLNLVCEKNNKYTFKFLKLFLFYNWLDSHVFSNCIAKEIMKEKAHPNHPTGPRQLLSDQSGACSFVNMSPKCASPNPFLAHFSACRECCIISTWDLPLARSVINYSPSEYN